MPKYVLRNVSCVIDHFKKYLNCALFIEDNIIYDLKLESSNLDIKDFKEIDLKSKIIIPAFVDIFNFKHHKYNGYEIDRKSYTEIENGYRYNNINFIEKGNIESDSVIFDLFKQSGLLNDIEINLSQIAFLNKHYVVYSPSRLNACLNKLIIENIDSNLLIVKPEKSMYDEFIFIKDLKDINTLVQITSLNQYKLFNMDKRYGTLTKGKFANLLILNSDYSVCGVIKDGEIEYV